MDRSVAGRSPTGRLSLPVGTTRRRRRPARGRDAGTGRARIASGIQWPLAAVRRILDATRAVLRLIAARRRTRIALLALLLALPLVGGGWLLLRHSSLVSVRRVQISGVHGAEARAIDAALLAAGRHMSTLDVRVGTLRSAVAQFPVVREVHASASFPHGLHIRVVEQLPVAALTVGGTRTAVAANGVVLGPALLSGSLPTLNGSYLPIAGRRLSDQALLAPLAVLGAAPGALAGRIARVFSGPKGLTVAMSNGLLAYFGDAARPHAKWLSLARVLADQSSTGASYVDVRLPERPAAGFPPGMTRPAASTASGTSTAEPPSTSEPTVAALAAGLAGKGAAAGSSPGGEAGSASPSGTGTTSSTTPEAGSSTPAESTSTTHAEGSEASTEPGG